MTDLELMQILESPMSNFEKGQAIRNALKAAAPSALNIKPMQPRKKREPRQPKTLPAPAMNGTGESPDAH